MAALMVAALGQVLIVREMGAPWAPPALWVVAAALTVVAWGKQSIASTAAARRPDSPRWRFVVASLLLVPVAWAGAADNTFRWWGVAAWWGAMGLWLSGWRALARPVVREQEPWLRWHAVAFVGIIIAAALFRFWNITGLPQEMTSDHVEKLLDVQDILDGMRPIFFERNTGREPMQFYLTAILAGPLGFGTSHLALKLGTAFISLVTVPLTFLLARWGLGLPRGAALLSMALLAASKWHVEISRVGLRFPYAPLGVALTLTFFFRALRRHERRDWLLTGVAMAVALYGYTPARIVPLLLAAGSILWLLLEQARGRTGLTWLQAATNLALLNLTAAIGLVPLLRYGVDHPERLWYRTTTRIFQSDGQSFNVADRFLENCWNALRMFHYRGDEVWVNTLVFDPVLDRVTGVLLIVGVAILLAAAVRRRRAVELTLLLALPVLLLPSILALPWPRENPSVVRAGGALPVLMVIAALPLWTIAQAMGRRFEFRHPSFWRGLSAAILATVMIAIAQQNVSVYFGPYAEQYLKSSQNSSEIAVAIQRHVATIGGIEHASMLEWPYWVDSRAVGLNMGAPRWNNFVRGSTLVDDVSREPAPRLVVLPEVARDDLLKLQQLWPDAVTELVSSRVPTKSFYLVIRAPRGN
ncbi:MAG TPA: phospholipid carrier-dependent glycosyltransferase [Vicinamibacterales bacterium]